ncbi:MAG: HAD family hydrolase [Clostridia bacterium]|nr:HAD family hydrolase [Clostridia bacterium]
MKRKLIFLDIDGTLTPPGSNMPPASAREAIRRALHNGHKVFLCTGRNKGMLSPVLALEDFSGAVASAGGYVFMGDRVLFDCPMTDDQFHTAMRLLKDGGVFRTIETKDHTYSDENLGDFLSLMGGGNSELERWRKALAEQLRIQPLSAYDGAPVYKIVFMCNESAQLTPAEKALGEAFNFVVQDGRHHGCLNGEMINRKFDKGRGVRAVAEALGVGIEDTIGFGDSMNDLEMIETVGTSVCMENGSPLLKSKSSLVCPAVDQDGLSWAFERLGLIG